VSSAVFALFFLVACSPNDNNTGESIGTPTAYQPNGIIGSTLPDIVAALDSGEITSVELVQQYLGRIDAIDRQGPSLQAILSLNPDAQELAQALDDMRAEGNSLGALHGVPILLKDNIESLDNMPTTAGALALKDNVTGRDSPLVAGLRAQGAIILGKTNLSQWANFRSETSMSGWSALGGQVRNPHMLDRNPCGSSSGSGAATAASLAAASVGTETNGSIICPSHANGIVGFKPTVGVVPQDYIIPISESQDTAGPMTKSVMGAAMMMNAMATETPEVDYTAGLTPMALEGVRVGIIHPPEGSYLPIQENFAGALDDLRAAGAVLVEIESLPETPAEYGDKAYDLLKYEFKNGLNSYLASTDATDVSTRTLEALIAFNEGSDREMVLFDQSIFVASQAMGPVSEEAYKEAVELVQRTSREEGIDKLLSEYDVDVLVSTSGVIVPRIDPVNGDVWPGGWPGLGSLAARAGYPHATVPMGGFRKLPIGLSFVGGSHDDARVLAYAFAYEQQSQRRMEPEYLTGAEQVADVDSGLKPFKD